MANNERISFWSVSQADMLKKLQTTAEGLTSSEGNERLKTYGANVLKPKKGSGAFKIFLSQFKSPITLILIFAAGLSFFLHDTTDALIIIFIVLISSLLGFWQEKGAADAFEKLLSTVQIKAAVLRDEQETELPVEKIVPGDIILLNAGDIIPADSFILESKDLFVSEATLTGETYSVEKAPGTLEAGTPLAKRKNSLWMGTNVVSGSGKALVVATGKETEFGEISEKLKLRPPETDFEKGILHFGNMFSMAGASLFLPFLPLLPKQILLINLMTDFPEMTIATDEVDPEMIEKPRSWNISFIRKFMLVFGLTSSVFDYLTFGVLLFFLPGMIEQFRTGWFIESIISASLIVLVIRSRRPFFKSRPGKYLLLATLLIVGITLLFPFTPLAAPFGFKPLPVSILLIIGVIIGLYILTAETIKRFFYDRVKF